MLEPVFYRLINHCVECDTTANYCVSEENSIVTDECTSRLLHCTEGTYASSVPVPGIFHVGSGWG